MTGVPSGVLSLGLLNIGFLGVAGVWVSGRDVPVKEIHQLLDPCWIFTPQYGLGVRGSADPYESMQMRRTSLLPFVNAIPTFYLETLFEAPWQNKH